MNTLPSPILIRAGDLPHRTAQADPLLLHFSHRRGRFYCRIHRPTALSSLPPAEIPSRLRRPPATFSSPPPAGTRLQPLQAPGDCSSFLAASSPFPQSGDIPPYPPAANSSLSTGTHLHWQPPPLHTGNRRFLRRLRRRLHHRFYPRCGLQPLTDSLPEHHDAAAAREATPMPSSSLCRGAPVAASAAVHARAVLPSPAPPVKPALLRPRRHRAVS